MYPTPRPPVVYRLTEPHPGARLASLVFGLLAAVLAAAVVLLRTGVLAAAIAAVVVVLGVALYSTIWARRAVSRGIATLLFFVVVGAAWWLSLQAVILYRAFTSTEGPTDPADPASLAAAEDKIAAFDASASFRIELTESEIQAVIQDGLAKADSPLERVDIDIVDGQPDGLLRFVGVFKRESVEMSGALSARLVAGAVRIELVDLDLGSLAVPDIAEGAIEDFVESLADLNRLLAEHRADVQSIVLADDRLLLTGTQGDGDLITSAGLLADLETRASAGTAVDPPPERLGPGVIDGTSAPGAEYYVALGDSLAANVGVDRPRDGYVSRVHRQLQLRDATEYGLRNFGISGETSGTLIRSGQLDDALEFIGSHDVAYVTIDIGANDLLGHLGSDDCSVALDDPACAERIDSAFALYTENVALIFDRLREAAPEATIVFMRAYNPFSLGLGTAVAFEVESNVTLDAFNDVAAGLAVEHGILVADAFTPMQGTTAATTHILDSTPDIHPVAIGYDVLAFAIVSALPN